MGRRKPAEGRSIVYFRGVAHEMDDQLCRMALIRCQIAGEVDSMQGLADALDMSRSTVSRFFSRRPGLLDVCPPDLGQARASLR